MQFSTKEQLDSLQEKIGLCQVKMAWFCLGTMGSRMAQNLLKARFKVQAWNRTLVDRPMVQEAIANGVDIKSSIEETVKDRYIIGICAGNEKSVIEIVDKVVKYAKSGTIIIDFTTIGVKPAQENAERLKKLGITYIDAPVSGGDVGAENATLTIMAGGDKDTFDACLPIFKAIGKNIIYCGESGMGQAVKMCNQLLCAEHMVALSEAIVVAEKLGLDPALMLEVCSSGAAGSWAVTNLGSKVAQNEFDGGFKILHMAKDLRLAQEALGDTELPGLSLAREMFNKVQAMGGDNQGTQAMIRAYRK